MGLMNLNHLFKAVRSQLALGDSIKTIEAMLIDPGVLLSTNLDKDVVIVRNCKSETKTL